jgi:hypothetical protein
MPGLVPGIDIFACRHCEERSDEAIRLSHEELGCFAEPVIGPDPLARKTKI